MTKQEMIEILAKYRRPGTPVFDYHFQKLPSQVLRKRNVPVLLGILSDTSLPAIVRRNAAGALGEIGDQRAVEPLIQALGEAQVGRGAAIALGRMKAETAAEALRELAPQDNAARWALSQVSSPATVEEAIEDLQSGQLGSIGPKVKKLGAEQAQAVSAEVRRRLKKILAAHSLAPEHRWLITTLQFLAPPEAGKIITEALKQAINLEGCCGCTLNRLLRAAGEIRPPQAIPALVDVICQEDSPIHKHLAAVCIEKIMKVHDGQARAALLDEKNRLRRELDSLENQLATTKLVTPDRPWHQPPGSPRWVAAVKRTIKAIASLLAKSANFLLTFG